ncbi:hypothetical protein A3K64_03835 [Candidatus Micrarchaeota archaeon RBG_16_36_9]|nr:MAG: hypothetical protein A3K64_03835 [Candidatus Micrarchaeota archaeon RBG_16_36_9]
MKRTLTKEKIQKGERILKYLSYISMVIGISLLGIVFIYYMVVFSASIGLLAGYTSVAESIGFNLSSIYCNLFFVLFSMGSLGAILTYIGWILIPRILKEYL